MSRNLPQFLMPAGTVVLRARKASVFLPERIVRLGFRGLPVARLLELCDGATPYREIRARLAPGVRPAKLDRFVGSLLEAGVLIDAAQAAAAVLRLAENPSRIGGPPPDDHAIAHLPRRAAEDARRRVGGRYRQPPRFGLRSLLERRRSVRDFSGRPLKLSSIVGLLWAANGCVARGGRVGRTAPSAGALYPLTLGLINLRAIPGLQRGVYLAHFSADGGVGLKKLSADPAQGARAFTDPAPLERAQGAIVVFGDLARTAAKYRNRSALLVPLEAGHAVQSALLAAVELGVGAVEICGFFEERLRALFGARALAPLSTVIFGAPAPAAPRRAAPRVSLSFEWSDREAGGYRLPFHLGSTRVRIDGHAPQTCWGRSADPLLAWRKANAEAIERLGCALPQALFEARIAELPRAIDPRALVAYDESQHRSAQFPFQRFRPQRAYLWKEGRDLVTGKRRAALAELVYYRSALPRAARENACTAASTSGVAAFPTWEGALARAALELLERDAFMRAWLLGETGAAVRAASLSGALAARIGRLRAAGVRTVAKILRHDPAFVCMIFAQHPQRGFTRVTSGAALHPEQAIDHALQEAEAQAALRLGDHPPEEIRPEAVRSPADHGRLYAQRRYFRRADFLGRARATVDLGRLRPRRGGELDAIADWLRKERRTLAWFDLAPPDDALPSPAPALQVVRALVPGLIPISFGYRTEPLVPGTLRSRQPRFPHPFA